MNINSNPVDINPVITLADKTMISFNEIYDRYWETLVVYARRFLKDVGDCESVVQDAFIALWERASRLQGIISVDAFLYTAVQRKALNILQRRSVEQAFIDFFMRREENLVYHMHISGDDRQLQELLVASIESLPENYRKICYMHLENLNNQEIAKRLNVSLNTIKYHKKNIYRILRDKLKNL